jgi:hypothetical protein
MPIKTPSFSSLVVSSESAGSIGDISTEIKKTPKSIKEKGSSKKRSSRRLTSTTAVSSTVTYGSTNTVYEFDSTYYDLEITGSCVTSAYPVIIATLPFKNLYESGDLSNFGSLYEIQNELRDATIIKANQLVTNYLNSSQTVSASLEKTSSENYTKYTVITRSVPQILNYKEDLVRTTEIKTPSDSQNDKIDTLTSTTTADAAGPSLTSTRSVVPTSSSVTTATAPSIGSSTSSFRSTTTATSAVATSSSTSGTGGNISVVYVDDDIQKYESGTDILEKLSERLLGENRPVQQKTTRQYQLLKAAISQVTEGIRFNNIEYYDFYKSPYAELVPFEISSIYQVTSKKISAYPGFLFAKKTLDDAAEVISNDYLPTSRYSNSKGSSFLDGLNKSGLFYSGKVSKDSSGKFYIPDGLDAAGNFVNLNNTGLIENRTTPRILPVLSLKSDLYTQGFIDQIAPVLAAEITEAVNTYPKIPKSIDPYAQEQITVTSTIGDDIRFITEKSDGQKLYLFDNAILSNQNEDASPISSIMLYDIDEIEKLRSDLDNLVSSLESFSSSRKTQISNQCSMTILSIFYQKIYEFFTKTILGTGKGDIYTAIRTLMFIIAANDQFSAGKLFRIIFDNENETSNMIARGSSLSFSGKEKDVIKNLFFTGAKLATSDSNSSSAIKYGKEILYDVPKTTYSKKQNEETNTFLKNLYSTKSEFQTICIQAVNNVLDCYPAVKDDKKLVTKLRLGFFTMLLFYLKKIRVKSLLEITFDAYEAAASNGSSMSDQGFGTTVAENLDNPKVEIETAMTWKEADVLFMSDCIVESFNNISAENLKFENFKKKIGSTPSAEQLKVASAPCFRTVRSSIKNVLQISQDIKSLLAYQMTVLRAQIAACSSISVLFEKLINIYAGDKAKVSLILRRYGTLESVIELLYQAERNRTLIPGTEITSNATRSENYRSIVKMAFKNYLPKSDDISLAIVGLPYGHLERLRLSQNERNFYYNCRLFGDNSKNYDESMNSIDFSFPYIRSSKTNRPNAAGPFLSLYTNLYDDFSSSRIVESMQDSSISLMKINEAISDFDVIERSEVNTSEQSIDFPAEIIQAALQSFIEDIYGIYPRYASFKGQIGGSYPEEKIADDVLMFNGIKKDTTEEKLLYSRLKSTIMMHRLFLTTRMIDQAEASPLFDKIHYSLVDGSKFKDVITEFYAKVDV